MRIGRLSLAILILAAASRPVRASDPHPEERGYPILQTYGPSDYDAGTQNFDLAQGPSGLLYVANLQGLLIHDGAWWRSVSLSNGRAVFCVAADAQGRVAAGGVGDFGYLEPDASGTTIFESLLSQLPPEQRDVGDVWSIHAMAHGFVYLSDAALFLWNGQQLTTLARFSKTPARPRAYQVGDRLFVWIPERGLCRVGDDGVALVPGGEAFRERRIDLMLPGDGDEVVIAVRGEGLRLWRQGTETPWAPEVSPLLSDAPTDTGVRLPDGRYALGTRGSGLLLLRADGTLDRVIDAEAGLPNDLVHRVLLDREGSLWLALDDGLARIEAAAPLSVFDGRSGLEGGVDAVARHAGVLWVGTHAGLFRLQRTDGRPRMQRIASIPADVAIPLDLGDTLLVGTRSGVYAGDQHGFRRLPGTEDEHVYALYRSPIDPARVWVGLRSGLTSLHRDAGRWVVEPRVADAPRYINGFVERPNGTLWCGSIVAGVVRVDVASRRAVSSGEGESNVFPVDDRILVADVESVLLLDERMGRPRSDPSLRILNGHGEPFRLAEAPDGSLWLNTLPPHVAASDGAGSYLNPRPLNAVGVDDIQSVSVDAEGVVWIGSNRGLFRYTGGYDDLLDETPAPAIRRVTRGGSAVVYGGAPQLATRVPELPFRHGRLRLEFAAASYRPGVEYQYRLDPVDDGWSDWSDEAFIEYTQLPEGAYSFHVRSRANGSAPSDATTWKFRVAPPWYRTPLAWLGWLAVAGLLMGGYVRVRTAALSRRARDLGVQVDARTTELREAVDGLRAAQREVREKNRQLELANARLELLSRHDELTGLWNRRHFDQLLPEEWNRARRHGQAIACLMMDLDHFKALNDQQGHPAGDDCLRQVGQFLEHSLGRSGELVARYGGEEFAMLLPGHDVEEARQLAERLRTGITALGIPHETSPTGYVSASFGVASLLPGEAQHVRELIERADQALYRAKADGRDCVRVAGG